MPSSSTLQERVQLARTLSDLEQIVSRIDSRYYASGTQRAAYGVIIHHLRAWNHWENHHD